MGGKRPINKEVKLIWQNCKNPPLTDKYWDNKGKGDFMSWIGHHNNQMLDKDIFSPLRVNS